MRSSWLVLVLLLASCGDTPAPPADASTDALDAAFSCSSAAACDDGNVCNGAESCDHGVCIAGARMTCDDDIDCTIDSCSEARSGCVHAVPDHDGDGSGTMACVDHSGMPLGDDCDDDDPTRFPRNREMCDAMMHDEDCDPTTHGGTDADGDGFESNACCNGTSCGVDCNDGRASVSPTSVEVCNAIDDDCDGMIDEGVTIAVYVDADHDGDGSSTASATQACASAAGTSVYHTDCDDSDATKSGRQIEVCDSIDNDCNGVVDDSTRSVTWYRDLDGDGFGSPASGTVDSCIPVTGYVLRGSDCDDTTNTRSPGTTEICDAIDDDCNGLADYVIAPGNLEDDDGDGVADALCGPPFGRDCNDMDPRAMAGAVETCNGRDDDCDGRIDENAIEVAWYRDLDGDGFGSTTSGVLVACTPQVGYVARGGDCNDTSTLVRPGASEGCNGVDDDCDVAVDEAPASTSCPRAHDVQACIAGACVQTGCEPGFADCSASAPGCESDITTLHDACGSCTHACGATEVCARGTCEAGVLDGCGRYVGGATGLTACPTITLTPVADATTSATAPTVNDGTNPTLFVVPTWGSVQARNTFMRFDLSSVPADAVVLGAQLQATAYTGFAYGGDGTCYTQFVADDTWGETTITYANQPSTDGVNVGGWWIWYNHETRDVLGTNQDGSFWPIVSREHVGDGLLSVRLSSLGYETDYRSREYGTAAQRPALVVGYLTGTTLSIGPSADSYVAADATTHGLEDHLDVDGSGPEHVLLRFPLGASIPAGAVIASATLTLTSFEGTSRGGDGTVSVHFVTDDTWDETTVSGTSEPTDDVTALGVIPSGSFVRTVSLTTEALRQAVVRERAGDGAISLRLESAHDAIHYRSHDAGVPASRPRLTVLYVVR